MKDRDVQALAGRVLLALWAPRIVTRSSRTEVSALTDFCQRLRSRSRYAVTASSGMPVARAISSGAAHGETGAAPSAAGTRPVTRANSGVSGIRRLTTSSTGSRARGFPVSREAAGVRKKAGTVPNQSLLSRTEAGFSPSAHWMSGRAWPSSARLNRCRHRIRHHAPRSRSGCTGQDVPRSRGGHHA
jgi:hypothetical protein